jgi:7-carboxy-7-deazaguanine synthase
VPRALRVSEIFDSLQGEGPCAGTPSAFLRLALCNLHCTWCDTRYTWDFERYDYEREVSELEPAAVAERISGFGRSHLVVTGGEPLMQSAGIEAVLEMLPQTTFVELETNGTLLPTPALFQRLEQINVSPKLSSAGDPENLRLRHDVLRELVKSDKTILKLVVGNAADAAEANALVERLGWPKQRTWLMPTAQNRVELQARSGVVVAESLRYGFKYSSRLHLELWNGERAR